MAEDQQGESSPDTNFTKQLEDLQQQVEKFKNDYLYLRAEFDNYKKHVIKERADLMKYGSEGLILAMVSLLDNFERALETKVSPENLKTYVEGVEMTAKEFRSTLAKFGAAPVESIGKTFDPAIHEAIGSEPTKEFKPGTVTRVLKKPYKLHDKVLRPGQVIVASE